jgi:LmbE family N-acetylglucosaminyl deacetylase
MTVSARPRSSSALSLGLALAALACAAPRPDSIAVPHSRTVDGGVARAPLADGPRVLGVIAHPDDEFAFAGVLFKTATHLGGVCELFTITDGQGGFKYATFGAALHGLDLTDETVGRRELPRIRLQEQLESARLLGVRTLHYLGQRDHRYTTELAEVLGPDADVWDLALVRRALDERLTRGHYDFVLVHAPTVTTHAHHQAASLLAVEAVQRMAPEGRPLVLCSEVEDGPDNGPPWIAPATKEVCPAARTTAGPFTFDRAQPLGYRGRLDYQLVINAAIGRHVTQGTMLRLIAQGTREEYWLLGDDSEAARLRCAQWFTRLAEPQYPSREYDSSAGVNTGSGAPTR